MREQKKGPRLLAGKRPETALLQTSAWQLGLRDERYFTLLRLTVFGPGEGDEEVVHARLVRDVDLEIAHHPARQQQQQQQQQRQ